MEEEEKEVDENELEEKQEEEEELCRKVKGHSTLIKVKDVDEETNVDSTNSWDDLDLCCPKYVMEAMYIYIYIYIYTLWQSTLCPGKV